MRKKLYFIALLCLSFFYLGCSSMPEQNTATIELAGNPTTGYTWVYTMSPEGIVREVSNDYIVDRADLIGSGGKFIYVFESITEGVTELIFSYLRVWEVDIPAVETLIYNAIVDGNNNLTFQEIRDES